MRDETVYRTLQELSNDYKAITSDARFTNMMNELKNNIQLQNVKLPSDKQRIKEIQKYFKKVDKKFNCFKKSWMTQFDGTEYQIISNSYSLFAMKDRLPVDVWNPEDMKENNVSKLPDVSSFLYNIMNNDAAKVSIDYKKLVNAINTEKKPREIYVITVNGKTFDSKRVKAAIDIMGENTEVFIGNYRGSQNGILYFKKSNGDMGMTLGFNMYDTDLNEFENTNGKIVEITKEAE